MKTILETFIANGRVYQNNKYNFLLLKELIEYARETDLNVKLKDIKDELISAGWSTKKISVLTTNGYQSKDVWISEQPIEITRSVPVDEGVRKNLEEEEEEEATRLINLIFENYVGVLVSEVSITDKELIFTNSGLKQLLKKLDARGSISKLSAIIRKKSDKLLLGFHFYGASSRTVAFKNYYKYER